jgi:hypothetical protein
MYYARVKRPDIGERPATIYGRTGLCFYPYGGKVHITENCKYLLDDGNFGLVESQNVKNVTGAVKYDDFGIVRLKDDNNVLNVGLVSFSCPHVSCVWWGNYAGEVHGPRGKIYEVLVYKPLA